MLFRSKARMDQRKERDAAEAQGDLVSINRAIKETEARLHDLQQQRVEIMKLRTGRL